MKSAFIWIVFLACASACLAAPSILCCRCPVMSRAVRINRIEDVQVLEPRPYCSRKEVIVKLEGGSSTCLDPNEEFTKVLLTNKDRILRYKQRRQAALRSTIAPATAEPSTAEPSTSRPIRTSTFQL